MWNRWREIRVLFPLNPCSRQYFNLWKQFDLSSGKSLFDIRNDFYRSLSSAGALGVLAPDSAGTPSATISDGNNARSREIGYMMVKGLGADELKARAGPQGAGKIFEQCVATYLDNALRPLGHLAPGGFSVERVKMARAVKEISKHIPYEHLGILAELIRSNDELESVVGNIYEVDPDVIVLRQQFSDDQLESNVEGFLEGRVSQRSKIRSGGEEGVSPAILHAVISCKWTLRSDRAQNARSEALGLIRNRKGRLPHICVVTAEPLPSRIQSLAMGTGDIDAVYHIALDELESAVGEIDPGPRWVRGEDVSQGKILKSMIDGDRLKDISDLPIDLLI